MYLDVFWSHINFKKSYEEKFPEGLREEESLSQISQISKIIDQFCEASNRPELNSEKLQEIFAGLEKIPLILIASIGRGIPI